MIDIKENKKRRREIPSPFWILPMLETSAIVTAATATEEKKKDYPETTIVATTTIVAKARVAVTTAA